MIDIELQLREYGSFHDEEWGPIDAGDILTERVGEGPVRLVQQRQPTQLRRGWLVTATAGVAVLVLVGGVAFLFRASVPDAPVSHTVTESAPATATESLPPTIGASLGSSGWSVVAHDESLFGEAAMWGVAAGGPGFVAVGGESFILYHPEQTHFMDWNEYEYPEYDVGNGDAVVWTSRNGATWSRVPTDEAVFGGIGEQQMLGVTAGGPGLVAVGLDAEGSSESADAAVWTSVDGITWARVPHDEDVFGGEGQQRMLGVTVGGPGLVAVGFDAKHGSDTANAAVWTSVDGITWARVLHDEDVFGGEGQQRMLGVTSGGPGLVAVGSDGRYDLVEDESLNSADAAVWTSIDGIIWERIPHSEEVFGGDGQQRTLSVMHSVTSGGPGLVAVGMENRGSQKSAELDESDYDAAVWTSPDGITWTRGPRNEAVLVGPGYELMTSVIDRGSELVAVGAIGFDQKGWDAAVWTSSDGTTWTRVSHDESVFGLGRYVRMFGVAAGDSGLVAVGRAWGDNDLDAKAWQG
jgi:hypothetical protein